MSQLLQNAVYGGIMILAAAALRRGLKDRLIPEARLALWAVCLFRLLTPAAPESMLSLWRLGRFFAPEQQPALAPAGVPVADPAPAVGTAPVPAVESAEAAGAGVPWVAVLTAVWVIVGVALAVRFALSYVRTRRAVGRTALLGRDDPRYAFLPKCARLREGAMEGAPLTFGAVRPAVVLFPGLAGEELACVLAHEGVHASRRDNLWHYVTALALIVHWWNPAVWLMARLLRRDVELSCDRAAVKKLGAEKRAEYANALISMATQGKDPAFCQTFGRKAAEERVISIMRYKKTTIVGAALTLALVLAVSVGFASNPASEKANDTVEYHGRTYARADLSQETLDWLDWYLSLSEEGQMSVSMVPPELIDGLDVSAGGTDAGNTDKTAQAAPGDESAPQYVSRDGYKALLDRLVADGKMTQADADGLFSGVKQALEQADKDGWAAAIEANGSGGYAVKSAPLCALTDCGNTGVHIHDGVTYRGWVNKHAIPPLCTDEACAGFAPHWHQNGEVIFYYGYGTDAELPVCPVEGCATPGVHTHDVMVYACNGAHSGGVCDGSCLVYFEGYSFQESEVPVGEQGFTHDPRIEDPAGDDEPVACPPEAIDKTAPFGPHTCADCGVEGCTVDYLHMHSGSYTFMMGPVCTREDCNLRGSHDHDGVMYSCNGNCHPGGECDGSCYSYNEPATYVDPPAQNASSGQGQGTGSGYGYHGSSHHSESHHSGHH